jgi:hypothetical protein
VVSGLAPPSEERKEERINERKKEEGENKWGATGADFINSDELTTGCLGTVLAQ